MKRKMKIGFEDEKMMKHCENISRHIKNRSIDQDENYVDGYLQAVSDVQDLLKDVRNKTVKVFNIKG